VESVLTCGRTSDVLTIPGLEAAHWLHTHMIKNVAMNLAYAPGGSHTVFTTRPVVLGQLVGERQPFSTTLAAFWLHTL
jgi:hypothetical protein